jgi:hypothetical protein
LPLVSITPPRRVFAIDAPALRAIKFIVTRHTLWPNRELEFPWRHSRRCR